MTDDTIYGQCTLAAGGSQATFTVRGRSSRHRLVNGWTVRIEAPPQKGETIILPVLSLVEVDDYIAWARGRAVLCHEVINLGERASFYDILVNHLRWSKQEMMKP